MSTDAQIQSEVEDLKSQFTETRALYREVCALLFFRYGITPTASKLYQHVRKGSMSAPAAALAKFWEELRSKARVEIDHPDLPDALKLAAGQAVSTLWGQATELARTELAALRVEARTETQGALSSLDQAQQRISDLDAQIQAFREHLAELESQLQSQSAALELERRIHAASQAKGEALQRQVDELKQEREKSRRDFSAELEKGREAIHSAAQRATEAERRALREIDQERTARANADKQLDVVRSSLSDSERHHQAKVLELSATQARMSAELDAARLAAADCSKTLQEQTAQLQQALQAASQHKAEAQTLRGLVEQFKPTSKPTRRRHGQNGA